MTAFHQPDPSKTLTEYTIDQAPLMVFWVAADGTLLNYNQRTLDVLGYTRAELDALSATDIMVGYEEDDRDRLVETIVHRGTYVVRAILLGKGGKRVTVKSRNDNIDIAGESYTVAYCVPIDPQKSVLTEELSVDRLEYGTERPRVWETAKRLGIIGASRQLNNTLDQAHRYAASSSPLLIHGESGTGKESLAKFIHAVSSVADQSYICVNCGSFHDELGYSELFGYSKGAFTGATQAAEGLFARAHGGTIFFDEVAELSPRVQTALLRVLQDGTYRRMGDRKAFSTNMRVVAATHRDLKAMVAEGTFREDLYYRLSHLTLALPPLRERTGDLNLLVDHMLERLNNSEGLRRQYPDKDCMEVLRRYAFPGNIRELVSILTRSYFDGRRGPLCINQEHFERSTHCSSPSALLSLDEVQRNHIRRVLTACDNKIGGPGGAAEILGLHRSTLAGKMRKLGIQQ